MAQAIGPTNSPAGDLAKQVTVGLARGLTSAAVRGGKVSFNQIATDAFGNAIGEGLAAGMLGGQGGTVTQGSGPYSTLGYANGMGMESDRISDARQNAFVLGQEIDLDDFTENTDDRLRLEPVGGPEDVPGDDAGIQAWLANKRAEAAARAASEARARGIAQSNAFTAQLSRDSLKQPIEERVWPDSGANAFLDPATDGPYIGTPNVGGGRREGMQPDGSFYLEIVGTSTSDLPTPAVSPLGLAMGAGEIAATGVANQAMRPMLGLMSAGVAAIDGVEAGADFLRYIEGRWNLQPSSAGAQQIAKAAEPLGNGLATAANRVRGFSENHIGLRATAFAGAGLQFGAEATGTGFAIRGAATGVARATGLDTVVRVPTPFSPATLNGGIWVKGIDNARYIQTVTPAMSRRYEGATTYRDPITNTMKPIPKGARINVDHIYPSAEVVRLDGFKSLTREQQTAILQDEINVGNLQALPSFVNQSKGSRMGDEFTKLKGVETSRDYREALLRQQRAIRADIQAQIDAYDQMNRKR